MPMWVVAREGDVRLTVSAFGLELDITLGLATATEQAEGSSLDGGTTASYSVGFSAWPLPEEVGMPQRCPAWDEPEEQA